MKLSLTSSPWNLVWIPLGLMLLALIAGDPNLVQHLLALWSSPTQLTHDFTAIYGGPAALMNAGLLMLLNPFSDKACESMAILIGFLPLTLIPRRSTIQVCIMVRLKIQ